MRVVREQMLCIISPEWPGGTGAIEVGLPQAELRAMLADVGVVHFASIALLPPLPGAVQGSLPSLVLELAVDEGVRPTDLLARLAAHPGGALWRLYQPYFPRQSPASLAARNAWLLQHLTDGLSVADGAFVGARDRSLRQIRQERQLYDATRAQARMLATAQRSLAPPEKRPDRAAWAFELARWAFSQSFVDEAAPAMRSFWRGAAASIGAKIGFFIAVAALVWSAVWAVRGLLRGVRWLWIEWVCAECCGCAPIWFKRGGLALWTSAVDLLGWMLDASLRFFGVLLIWVAFYALFWVALPAFVPGWRRWQERIQRELDRPTQTWSSRLTYVGGCLLLLPLVAALLFSLAFVLCGPVPLGIDHWFEKINQGRWWFSCIGVVVVLIACAVIFGRHNESKPSLPAPPPKQRSGFLRFVASLKRGFYRPDEDPIVRAQQVHPSIEACEATLVDATAHMISLTELRWPRAWSALWTIASLRVVTFFGRILFTEGRLGDAPGIHFGHWHLIDGGRRLLFISNFDGYFGGYLDDFINGAPAGVNLAWRWTTLLPRRAATTGQPAVREWRRFPPTRFLIYRGVKCELKFKAYARDSMLPHLFHFDACNLSLDDKSRATALRDALFGKRSDAKDDQIMRVIES